MVGSIRTFIDQARTGSLDDVLTVGQNKKQLASKSGVLGTRSAKSVPGNKIGPGEKNALESFKKALEKDFGDDGRDLLKAIGIDDNTKVLTKGHVEALRIELMHVVRQKGDVVVDPKQLEQQQYQKDDLAFLKHIEHSRNKEKHLIGAAALRNNELAALRIALSSKEADEKKLAFKKLHQPIVQPKRGKVDQKKLKQIVDNFSKKLDEIESRPYRNKKIANGTVFVQRLAEDLLGWMSDVKQLAAKPAIRQNPAALMELDKKYERAKELYQDLAKNAENRNLNVVPTDNKVQALLQHKIGFDPKDSINKKLDQPIVQPNRKMVYINDLDRAKRASDENLDSLEVDADALGNKDFEGAEKVANGLLVWMTNAQRLANRPGMKKAPKTLTSLSKNYNKATQVYRKLMEQFKDAGIVVPNDKNAMALVNHKIKA